MDNLLDAFLDFLFVDLVIGAVDRFFLFKEFIVLTARSGLL